MPAGFEFNIQAWQVVGPDSAETVTPEQTYYRLHGATGSRHVHIDDELRPRAAPTGDAEGFLAVLPPNL